MKALAIILNVLIPGVGSFVVGKVGQGLGQIIIWGLGFLLTVFTLGFGAIIGFPMMLAAWIWGLVTVLGSESTHTVNVNVVNPQAAQGLVNDQNQTPVQSNMAKSEAPSEKTETQ